MTASAASSGVRSGQSALPERIAQAPPTSCAAMYPGTDAGAMPAKVLENMRPTLIAGLAKLAELVKK